MACWTCGAIGDGDPSLGIHDDDGICPACAESGYEAQCAHGCYTDPTGEWHECSRHAGNRDEAAYEQYLEAWYGSNAPRSVQEQYDAALAEKRRLR